MARTYILRNINSNLGGGADFSWKLLTASATEGTKTITLAASETRTSFGFSEADDPDNNLWDPGNITVKINIYQADANAYASVQLHRVDYATGAIIQLQERSDEQSLATTGVKTFTFSGLSWSQGSSKDRLRVSYIFRNDSSKNSVEIKITANTTNSEVVTPFTYHLSTAIPSPISLDLTPVAPTVSPGAVTISLSAIVLILAVAYQTVSPGAVALSPDPVPMTLSIVTPTIVPGAASVSPTPVVYSLNCPDPSLVPNGLSAPLVTTWYSDNKAPGFPTDGEADPISDHPVCYCPKFSAIVHYADLTRWRIQIADNQWFNSPILDTNGTWGTAPTINTRCQKIQFPFDGTRLQDGVLYYWRISFGTSSDWKEWSSAQTFYGVVPQNWAWGNRRATIRFGESHSALPAGYTAELVFPTGYGHVIAENADYGLGVDNNVNGYAYHKGFTYATWIGRDVDGYNVTFMRKLNWATGIWDDPVIINAEHIGDTHYYCVVIIGNDEKIHVVKNGHNSQASYSRTVGAHIDGQGINIVNWENWETPAAFAQSTYVKLMSISNGDIFAFFRHNIYCMAYARWNHSNQTWGSLKYIAVYDLDFKNSIPCIYCGGALANDNDRVHITLCWHENYADDNTPRAISHIYADLEDAEYSNWYEVGNSNKVGITTSTISLHEPPVPATDNVAYSSLLHLAKSYDADFHMHLSSTDSDLTGGADFNKKLSLDPEMPASLAVMIGASATEISYGFTESGVPGNASWGTQGLYLNLNVLVANTNLSLKFTAHRISSTGTVLESSAETSAISLGMTGWKSARIDDKLWTNGSSTDRIRLDFKFINSVGSSQTVTIATNMRINLENMGPMVGTNCDAIIFGPNDEPYLNYFEQPSMRWRGIVPIIVCRYHPTHSIWQRTSLAGITRFVAKTIGDHRVYTVAISAGTGNTKTFIFTSNNGGGTIETFSNIPDSNTLWEAVNFGLAGYNSDNPSSLIEIFFKGDELPSITAQTNLGGGPWPRTKSYLDLTGPNSTMMWNSNTGGHLTYDGGTLYVHAFVRRLEGEYFGGEHRRWASSDLTNSWESIYLSAQSGVIAGGLSILPRTPAGMPRQIICCRGNKIVWMKDVLYPSMRPDGADIRIFRSVRNMVDGDSAFTEIDRLPDIFQLDSTKLYFATQGVIASNKNYETNYLYEIYWADPAAEIPACAPSNVWPYYDSFELYDSNTSLNGQGGWVVTGGGYAKVFSTQDMVNDEGIHVMKIGAGDKAVKVYGPNEIVERTIGTDLSSILVSARMYIEDVGTDIYLEIYDETLDVYFRIGFDSTGYACWWDDQGTKTVTSVAELLGSHVVQLKHLNSYVYGYIDGVEIFSDICGSGFRIDKLRIGSTSGASKTYYFDIIIWERAVETPPEVTAVNSNLVLDDAILFPDPVAFNLGIVNPSVCHVIAPDPVGFLLGIVTPDVRAVLNPTPTAFSLGMVNPVLVPGTVTLSPSPVVFSLEVQAPTFSVGSVTLSPDPTSLILAIQSPMLIAGAVTLNSDAIGFSLGIQAPILIPGAVDIFPDPVLLGFNIIPPSIICSLNPDSVAFSLSVIDPGNTQIANISPVQLSLSVVDPVLGIGAVDLNPDPVSLDILIQAPELIAGMANLNPNPIIISLIVIDPNLAAVTVNLNPEAVDLLLVAVSPTLMRGVVTLSPDPIDFALAIISPNLSSGAANLSPDALGFSLSIQAPSLEIRSVNLNPDPILFSLETANPTLIAGIVNLIPDPCILLFEVVSPTISTELDLSPFPIALNLSIPAPALVPGPVDISPDPVMFTLGLAVVEIVPGMLGLSPNPVVFNLTAVAPLFGIMLNPSPAIFSLDIPAPTLSPGAVSFEIAAVVLDLSIPTPALASLSGSLSPEPVIFEFSLGIISLTGDTFILPDPVDFILAVVAPSLSAGAMSMAVTPVAFEISAPDLLLAAGAIILNPDPISYEIAMPDILITFWCDIYPDPISYSMAIVSPEIEIGQISINIFPITYVLDVPNPRVQASGFVDIDPDPIGLSLICPDILLQIVVTSLSPDSIEFELSIPAIELIAGAASLSPRSVYFILTTPNPTLWQPPGIKIEIVIKSLELIEGVNISAIELRQIELSSLNLQDINISQIEVIR